jgi:hypothetical protein
MPIRKAAEREKIENDVAVFLASGGEVTKFKITARADKTKLSQNAIKYINAPLFLKGL